MNTKRILLIAQNLPYPAFAGLDLRNWQNVNALTEIGEVGVFGSCSRDPRVNESLALPELAFYRCSSDPQLGYPSLSQAVPRNTWLFQPLGHPSDLYFTDVVVHELRELMNAYNPELVILESLWLHRYLNLLETYPCEIILDCHNVEGALAEEIGKAESGSDLRTKITRKILPEPVKDIEEKAVHQANQIWVCSIPDARLLERLYNRSVGVHVVPNGIDVSYYCEPAFEPEVCTSLKKSRSIIFPGMYAYAPTRNGAHFLIQELFPRVAAVFPDTKLVLAGNWPTNLMLKASQQDSRILVTGPVPDMRPYLRSSSVLVAPIFQGGGTRFKLLEAFAAGVPVISTAKGAEGLEVENGKHLLIAEDAHQFMNCLNLLWQNEKVAADLIRNATELVQKQYSWSMVKQKIFAAIIEIEAIRCDAKHCKQ